MAYICDLNLPPPISAFPNFCLDAPSGVVYNLYGQEWKGQRFKKLYVRKITQHEEKFFQLSFKGMIRFDLNMEHDEEYGKFVLTVCICSILYFRKRLCLDSASLFTRGIIKNIILSCFNFCESSKWKEQIVFMNICKVN